jgi:hypothetical protein
VQSDLHMLLAAGPLDLGEDKLTDITLESPAGQRRRIDVEVGFTVFEVKRDLRAGNVRADAVTQLGGYVAARTEEMQQRYVGVLTDGAEWDLYNLAIAQDRPSRLAPAGEGSFRRWCAPPSPAGPSPLPGGWPTARG